jgi:hypothetical protein
MRSVALALLATASLGCPRFQPTLPMHATTGDVDLALSYLRFRGPQVVLISRSTVPHTLVRAWATVPSRSPCTGGVEADALIIDEGVGEGFGAGGALTPGTHQVALRFPDGSLDYTLDTVADLEIEEGACLRAPVLSQSVPLVPQKRPVLVISTGLLGNPDIGGLRAVTSLEVGAGGWLGPFLVNVQVGAGAAICNSALCGKDSSGNLNSGLAIPLALEARYGFGAGVLGRLQSAWFLGGRYAFEPVWLPATTGERSFQLQTLTAVLGWGSGDASRGPFRHLERAVPFEMAIPLGVAVAPDGLDRRVAFTGGLELRFLLNL